jgi:hypothetical protein
MEAQEEPPVYPRAYHIKQEACNICNTRGLQPSECIVVLAGEVATRSDKREIQQMLGETVRQVTQVEGVVLHEKQKGFFRDLAMGMIKHLKGEQP